jgi:hypothetical protein
VQTSVFGPASGQLPAHVVDVERFTTNTSGRVDVTLDWTFPSSPMGVYVAQGSCDLDQFNARSCNFLIRSEPGGPKPRKVSASGVSPGAYSLLIGNFADVQESVSAQVFLSSGSCAPFATQSASHAGGGEVAFALSGALRQ